MATLTQAAVSGTDAHAANSTRQRGPNVEANANANASASASASTSRHTNGSAHKRSRSKDSKYRHVFATHCEARTTCLSHESTDTPSFIGFRNLMILVLSTQSPLHLLPQPQLTPTPHSRLQPATDDCEPPKVRRPHLHQLPRLPPLRRHHRPAPLPARPRPSLRHIPDRTRGLVAGQARPCKHHTRKGRRLSREIRRRPEELQCHLAHRGLLSQPQRRLQPRHRHKVRLLRHLPPGHRHPL